MRTLIPVDSKLGVYENLFNEAPMLFLDLFRLDHCIALNILYLALIEIHSCSFLQRSNSSWSVPYVIYIMCTIIAFVP